MHRARSVARKQLENKPAVNKRSNEQPRSATAQNWHKSKHVVKRPNEQRLSVNVSRLNSEWPINVPRLNELVKQSSWRLQLPGVVM
jgi:ribosomal protein L18E